MTPIILASGSLRRQELLKQMGIPFKVLPQDVDETFNKLDLKTEAMRLAKLKVETCAKTEKTLTKGQWILGADTFIQLDNKYIGKAKTRKEAELMLKNFSGKKHSVITGLALLTPLQKIITESCITEVEFSDLSEKEIEWYLDSKEWMGVAGAYRIQEKGGIFIKSIKGSYFNVMGLPINIFYGILCANNYNFHD